MNHNEELINIVPDLYPFTYTLLTMTSDTEAAAPTTFNTSGRFKISREEMSGIQRLKSLEKFIKERRMQHQEVDIFWQASRSDSAVEVLPS